MLFRECYSILCTRSVGFVFLEHGKQLWALVVCVCAAQRAGLICHADRVCLGFSEALCMKNLLSPRSSHLDQFINLGWGLNVQKDPDTFIALHTTGSSPAAILLNENGGVLQNPISS